MISAANGENAASSTNTCLADTLARVASLINAARSRETWLKAHPKVEIVSRDCSKAYKRGITGGAPDAIQVADCLHLLQNLEEVLEKVFKGYTQLLKKVEKHQLQASKQPVTPFPEPQDISPSEKEQNRCLPDTSYFAVRLNKV